MPLTSCFAIYLISNYITPLSFLAFFETAVKLWYNSFLRLELGIKEVICDEICPTESKDPCVAIQKGCITTEAKNSLALELLWRDLLQSVLDKFFYITRRPSLLPLTPLPSHPVGTRASSWLGQLERRLRTCVMRSVMGSSLSLPGTCYQYDSLCTARISYLILHIRPLHRS